MRNPLWKCFNAAKALIEDNNVEVLMGFQALDVAAATAEFSNRARVPMISLTGEIPTWASQEWPFLLSAGRSQRAQMKAVVAIVQSWKWWRVTIIYEDTGSASDENIPHLINDIQDAGVVIEQFARLSPLLAFSDTNYLHHELSSLKAKQCRLFIVHTSVKLASNIFIQAKKLGMMENGSVWITTSTISNELDSLNETTISSMEGVLGVQSYFPKAGNRFKRFAKKFRELFKSLYPNEHHREPGLYALQAYDALWALALATNPISNSSTMSGEFLLQKLSNSNFQGLNGEFKFSQGRLKAQKVFRIVNVYGKGYGEIGYWSDGLGFSVNIANGSTYDKYMSNLKQVLWPGKPTSVPMGYTIPTDANPLIIGVPANPAFDDFVKVHCKNSSCTDPTVTGFSVDVFKATLAHLPYNVSYKFVPYNGTYDSMIQQVQNQTFQVVIGDTSILAERCKYAQFTPPYSEPGLQAVIYEKNQPKDEWLFMKPFTTPMWIFTGLVNIYNGFVVWLIERRHNSAFRGSIWNQIGTMFNLAFTTLFSLHGGKLHSNLSRVTMVVWLFVALVVTQSYTASLTSSLTAEKINGHKLDIQELKINKEKVGCSANSFVGSYLQVLGFPEENILKVSRADEYPQLLKNGTIKAAFLISPYVKIFLAKYCNKGFTTAEPTYKIGGFGFAFTKGHPLLPDISQAVLNVTESWELKSIESKMLSKYNCSNTEKEDDKDKDGLELYTFRAIFGITVGTSTVALFFFCVSHLL
ncbi:unnamed protein product [Rhodiola kirilowii]